MKAMILAAGLGTRLRPLTDDRPKALVTVAGRTLLELALCRLRAFGVHQVIVNTHHYADMLIEYLHANHNFGMTIEISREEGLLDTGGGLKNAAPFFLDSSSASQEPFILHNVDVLSSIDLDRMMRYHIEQNALATLAVQDRATSRYLLFDQQNQLCGRRAGLEGKPELARPTAQAQALAFSGIHILSPCIFSLLEEEGAFSIIPAYLRLAAQAEKIVAYRADDCYWRDLGRPQSIVEAARDLDSGKYSIA
ncbi:MAG: nucleotidyltransferase family protein [Terracidiphilus sp.]|nr:nucleotidyltransferase family protein [Terracidiphilus sp.]MDR3777228.1 nucleotidyltransferase family protein [Terracidiphilus sp.]